MGLKAHVPGLGKLVEIVEDRDELAVLRVCDAVGVLLQQSAASLSPYKLITWIWSDLVKRKRVNLQTDMPVLSIDRADVEGGKWVVSTSGGEIMTSHVLLATNAYTSHLLPQFQSLIVPVQAEMSALQAPNTLLDTPLKYTYSFVGGLNQDRMQDDYLVQRPAELGGELMFGGGRMVAKNAGVGTSDDGCIDPKAAKYLRRMLPRMLEMRDGTKQEMPATIEELENEQNEAGDMEAKGEWTGIFGYSRDGRPWVGGVPGMHGIWLCGGYTGHGKPGSPRNAKDQQLINPGMVNAPLSATHIGRMIGSAMNGFNWAIAEQQPLEKKDIPASYVISEERIQIAHSLPEMR